MSLDWAFVHFSHNGNGIPNFLRPFTWWTAPKLFCKVMSQTRDCFPRFLKFSNLWCRLLWKEKTVKGDFVKFVFAFDSLTTKWRDYFLSPPPIFTQQCWDYRPARHGVRLLFGSEDGTLVIRLAGQVLLLAEPNSLVSPPPTVGVKHS